MDQEILERAQNAISTNSTKSQNATIKKTGLPITWVSAIFKKFAIRYHYKWSSAMDGIEDDAIKEWSIGLDGLTGEQIKHGLESWKSEWPPSLPEFREICEQKSKALHKPYIPLPAPTVDKSKAQEYIDSMRKLYKG